MRYFNSVLIATAFLFTPITYSQTLSEQLDTIIDQQLPHATVGVLIKDARTGEVIYSRNANKFLTPASSTKLFTAAAALYHLKPDFRFLTTLSQKDQNYYLKFTGSPSLTDENLTNLILNLKKNNITTINGNIVIDSTEYQAPFYPSGNSYDDLGWYYTAPDTAAMLNENSETYELISAKTLGMPAEIKPKTVAKALTIINDVKTVSNEEEKNHCSLHIEVKPNNTLRLYGCAIQTKNPKIIELAIPDPVLFVKQVTQKALANNGIILKGEVVTGKEPSDATVIGHMQSAQLIKLVRHMLQLSDNLYANSFTKKLGYSVTGNGTHKDGIFAIKKILTEHTHLDMAQVDIVDGEGTRYNQITPEQFVMLLTDLYNDKDIKPILLTVLPQSGVSGSLQARMKNTLLEKKVFAKTGTMHDVSSLSGFIINPNAKSFVFSIITNGVNTPIEKAKALEEKILLATDHYYLETLSEKRSSEHAR